MSSKPLKSSSKFDIPATAPQAIHAATVLESWIKSQRPKLQTCGWIAVIGDIRGYARLIRDGQSTIEALEP